MNDYKEELKEIKEQIETLRKRQYEIYEEIRHKDEHVGKYYKFYPNSNTIIYIKVTGASPKYDEFMDLSIEGVSIIIDSSGHGIVSSYGDSVRSNMLTEITKEEFEVKLDKEIEYIKKSINYGETEVGNTAG